MSAHPPGRSVRASSKGSTGDCTELPTGFQALSARVYPAPGMGGDRRQSVAFGGVASLQLLERYLERRKPEPIQASLRIQW